MLASFLSLPREIRDQIYYETLFSGDVARVGARAEKDFGTWVAGREHLPGYYRPLLHFHKAERPNPPDSGRWYNWDHKTYVAGVPSIFQVGGTVADEARELYLRNHVLFEMKILEDSGSALERWSKCLREEDLSMMQKLHLYVHVRLVFEGPDDDPLTKRLKEATDFSLDLVDPVFRIELQNAGENLAVVSPMRFNDDVIARIQKTMGKHFRARTHLGCDNLFTGADLVLATKSVLEAVGGYRYTVMNMAAHLDIKDVAHVYDYADKDDARPCNYGTVLRLHDRWPNVLVKFGKGCEYGGFDDGGLEGGLGILHMADKDNFLSW